MPVKIKPGLKLLRNTLLEAMMTRREKGAFLSLKSYLIETGWLASFEQQLPVGPDGSALPWATYPFIDFISGRIGAGFEIFEFGCGNSTLYYASKASSVTSVEHDRDWYEDIRTRLPRNAELIYRTLSTGGEYCMSAAGTGKLYDMIMVDGRDRVNCIISSAGALKDGGVVVLDDSERERYTAGIDFLTGNGFRKIDFWGIPPGIFFRKCTSVFYRDGNCLNI